MRTISSSSTPLRFTCAAGLWMLWAAANIAGAQQSDEEPGEEEGRQEEDFFGLGLLEQTREIGTTQANALAQRLDRFFGVERSDLEAAYSSLRLIPELRWHEQEGLEPGLRLRGKLHLPRINERLSLILSEDEGEGTNRPDNPIFDEPQSTKLNLELNLGDTDRHRLDFRVGLRSSLKFRSSIRYRYQDSLSDKLLHRLTETVYFIDGTGFGSFTEYELDRTLTSNSLVRWSNEYRHEENLDGDEWGTSLAHRTLLSNDGALSYFVRMAGSTHRDYIDLYQVGVRLRQNFARPWLFWEFAPGYQWEKTAPGLDREGSLFAVFRLEIAIGRQD